MASLTSLVPLTPANFKTNYKDQPYLKNSLKFHPNHVKFTAKVMGDMEEEERKVKPRVMCLHGFRTSAEIMRKQISKKWPSSVLDKFDFVYVDAPFDAQGKSAVDEFFDPPYYEWFQFDNGTIEYLNMDECIAFVEEYMVKNGPFDGLMGFSQGAILSAGLAGLQLKGLALTRVPKIKFLIIISGAKFVAPDIANNAFSAAVDVPSLHFLGETDYLKPRGVKLLDSFVNPTVIHHPQGHTVPRLDEKNLMTMLNFVEMIQRQILGSKPRVSLDEKKKCETHRICHCYL